ncbi:MAG: dihydroorotase [Bacillota bacterium]|uniref:Dihydroorotase n=1 Tax=Thermanaerosceptrum fracticalcis TaxID=1712410 RepID=A0A7G6E2L8_THEFR|nr:dihydroorotase [Thermanaerosceptrum fracticalcis]QNB46322.1 amidohydrolase family protein [Thermanaerosceptrum fracticalcis]
MITTKTLIKGGRVLDPASGFDRITDVLVMGKTVVAVGNNLPEGEIVVDARGKIVVPGLIDIHVHLRDPGLTYKEDLISGTRAAAHGGFTSIACMPNTIPVLDTSEQVRNLVKRARQEALVNVFPVAAVTQGSEGRILTDFQALRDAGAVALSDDGKVIQNSELMYRALLKGKDLGLPISQHAEDSYLSANTVVNEGTVSAKLGVKGDPAISEGLIVGRDIELAACTEGHVHIGHISTARAVAMVRQAKAMGIRVTAEVTPHHLLLTEEDVLKIGVNGKMRPPLRKREDVEELRRALADGTIDVIASDHAPHALSEKEIDITYAANGIVGLETAVGLILTFLVHPGLLKLADAIAAWTYKPAQIFNLYGKGRINAGYDADITIIDLHKKWKVDVDEFYSKGKNTPFNGWELTGKPVLTMVGGKIVWSEEGGIC